MLPVGDLPGAASVQASAEEGCFERVEGSIDLSINLDDYGLSSITPTAEGWKSLDDREVLCLVGRFDNAPTTSSVRL